ncbi:MAG TPA: hypothetical protein PKD53_20220 [Chloroflexaceae bacterium]|nr:hypothetical protein [Chloroflexaceae bacterium]
MTVSTTMSAPRVSDLVLDPFVYSDALAPLVREGRLAHEAADRLAAALPAAIAQLDALGDAYGAIALASLYEQLAGLQAVA